MDTTDAGRLGEIKTMAYLVENGWYPFSDLSGKCPVDILAWRDGETISIQVKTTSSKSKSGKYVVQIGSVRPNRNGNIIRKFDAESVDYLAVYIVPEDKVVIIKASEILTGRMYTIQTLEDTARWLAA